MEVVTLPELGENIEEVEVSAVLVAQGDEVRRDQPLIEVETEKASLEVPSTANGRVAALFVAKGDKIRVGQRLLEIDTAGAAAGAAKPASAPEPSAPAQKATRAVPPRGGPAEPAADEAATRSEVIDFPNPAPASREAAVLAASVPAAPSVRALARELGIDIAAVRGSGPGGRISHDDVKRHAKAIVRGAASGAAGATAAGPAPALPDFAQWGEIEREPLTGVRRATARAMALSWSTIPHVTQFDRADITQLESMRKRFNARSEAAERKLTLTAIVVKMVAAALRQFPKFNASLDLVGEAVVYKRYVNVGVAADTERGLLVPVIRDVDRKSLIQIAVELTELAGKARERKLTLDEMRGATFTVSNLGGLGTTYFSPIVNWPEVAILGVGRAEVRAVHEEGRFQPRLILPLSVSYDHRLIDGADAARFLRWLADALEQPLLLLIDD